MKETLKKEFSKLFFDKLGTEDRMVGPEAELEVEEEVEEALAELAVAAVIARVGRKSPRNNKTRPRV